MPLVSPNNTGPTFTPTFSKETYEEGFTQSELSMLDECPKKWNFRYNNKLNKNDSFNWYFWIGSAWHGFQELWRKQKGNVDLSKPVFLPPIGENEFKGGDFEQTLEYWLTLLPAYQIAYAKMHKGEEKHDWSIVEQELKGEILGIKLRGKLDLASTKPKFIRDFKTTSSAWLISPNGWQFKLQFMLYCWLMRKNFPKDWSGQFDFQMDIMQRPGLKQTKADGTFAGHLARVFKDIQERAAEMYLKRSTATILPEAIQRFEDEVLVPKVQRLVLAYENPEEATSIVMNPNTNACNNYNNQCEFFEICERGWAAGKHFYHNRAVKHQEL